jgi:hypothetical protein
MDDLDEHAAVVRSWAEQQAGPWLAGSMPWSNALALIDNLNNGERNIYLLKLQNGQVAIEKKPVGPWSGRVNSLATHRAGQYRDFIEVVSRRCCPGLTTTLAIYVGDQALAAPPMPVFAFQKPHGNDSLLLPDVDLLESGFPTVESLSDPLSYLEKNCSAIFVGSTTGRRVTEAVVRELGLPRLRSAVFFRNHPLVDFRLPNLVQWDSSATKQLLREMGFGDGVRVSWPQQFRHRFIISMDGNGASCGRVVRALLSNSVLLKYDSPHTLYYFSGLQPWLHYVPISCDEDVVHTVELELGHPGYFADIARAGQRFAQTLLSRDSAILYTSELLRLYSATFTNMQLPPPGSGG